MPTYEYRCQKCLKNFEIVQSMKDPHFKTCPEAVCQNEGGWAQGEVTRLLGTGAGLIFKGSGFYITDYRSENYKEGAKKDAPASTPAAGGDKGAAGGSGGEKSSPAAVPAPKAKGDAPASSSGGTSSSSSPAAGSSSASSAAPKT